MPVSSTNSNFWTTQPKSERQPNCPSMTFEPFVITSLPRCGSFMMTTALDSHPDICCYGEALSRFNLGNKPYQNAGDALMSEVYSPGLNCRAAGFKLLFGDAGQEKFSDAQRFLIGLQAKVIHLRRKNLLKRYVSFLLATQTDVWIVCSEKEQIKPIKLEINPNHLLHNFNKTLAQYRQMDREFSSCNSLTVWYEDFVSHCKREMDRIFAFLKLVSFSTRPETLKQERRTLKDIISNYDEIHHVLLNEGLSDFLI